MLPGMDTTPKNNDTRTRLIALLRADKTISAAHRARIVAAFDDRDGERPAGWGAASIVAKDLDLPLESILRWADEGRIEARRLGARLTLVCPAEVARHAARHFHRRPGKTADGGDGAGE